MNVLRFGLAVALVGMIWFGSDPAFARSGIRVGTLTCNVEGGVGLVLGSRRNMTCTFRPTSGRREAYRGRITRVGLDIGVTRRAKMTWLVFAPGKLKPGSLAGNYGGASAQAAVGVGLGANVLVGGFKKSIALQPISVQGQTGLNLAAGVAGLRLRFAGN
ncbi:MAG: DUF992 domain-containing protein [Rhizobiales bacterium]|nr:DUF992 domain-containing protein [Hyphomicrobiales bacterium]